MPQGTHFVLLHNLEDPEHPGKSFRDVNLEKQHAIPFRTLVEYFSEAWFGEGACESVIGRLFVVMQYRDCDGTPLYAIGPSPESLDPERSPADPLPKGTRFGFTEESLRPIEVTQRVLDGSDLPRWQDIRKEE